MLRLPTTFIIWLLSLFTPFAVETGAADTGAGNTGAADTGAADTGAADTGAADTGAGNSHWAFQPVIRPRLPDVIGEAGNPIDRFVRQQLEAQGIDPSGEADRITLLRRVTLDTTGLPPTPERVALFLADTRDNAYERLVDRLLASPQFGERWARHWLDGARYADSEGYESDTFRSMWRYRQYVISSINQDVPFDQFAVEQIAGDLLPEATDEQQIATAFCRGNMGASNHEPTRLEGVVDRVNTVGTVFMGLTIGCAQCHSHKFDPVSQREYYQLFAFFNTSEDPPLQLDTAEVLAADIQRIAWQVRQLDEQMAAATKQLEGSLDQWLSQITDADIAKLPEEVRSLCRVPLDEQSDEQRTALLDAYGDSRSEIKNLKTTVAAHKKLADSIFSVPVMKEMASPRETTIFIRGDFENKGPAVSSNVPKVFPPMSDGGQASRLDFAQWLVSRQHPLTSRVAVNRIWQQYFGSGIVETDSDFGTQASAPSHPQLLDWLAAEFMESGWQVKHVHRLILTSRTYRQSSDDRPELRETDSRNRLLARQNRLRLEAEAIRDQALAVSRRLDRQIGGPSVFPFQAEGVMEGRSDKSRWIEDETSAAQRRGLYVHFWRLTPHPYLTLFDAPDANTSCTRRQRSNTPMQALALLNHPWFTECAQALAARLLGEAHKDDTQRLESAYGVCLGRVPNHAERQILMDLLMQQRQQFRNDTSRARTVTGQEDQHSDAEVIELAAWSTVARTLLNLDEFITRE